METFNRNCRARDRDPEETLNTLLMRFASIKRWIFKTGVCIVILVGLTLSCFSQESQEELAKAAQNPIANMMSFPFQNNTNFGIGPYNRTQNVLNIQPVLPFFNGRLITRTILPLISQPDVNAETGGKFGLGDISFTAFYSPKSKGLIWGVAGNRRSAKFWQMTFVVKGACENFS